MKQLGLRVLHSCRAMPKQCHKDGLHTMVLPECSFRELLEAENEAWYSSDTAFQTYIIHRRVLSSDGDLLPLPVRAIAIFMKHGVAISASSVVGQAALNAELPGDGLRMVGRARLSDTNTWKYK